MTNSPNSVYKPAEYYNTTVTHKCYECFLHKLLTSCYLQDLSYYLSY